MLRVLSGAGRFLKRSDTQLSHGYATLSRQARMGAHRCQTVRNEEGGMKKVKCWKCEGTGKVPLELPKICIGAPGCPTHKKCDVCEGKGWNWE